jgi:hypothetical protein
VNGKVRCLATLALAAAAAPCWSQKPVYRCEQSGRVTYMDSPCKAGVEVPAADPRTDAERRAAADLVKREQLMAERMARERRATEAAAARRGHAHIRHSAAEQAASAVPSDDTKRREVRKPAKVQKTAPAPTQGAPLQR